MSEEKKTVLVTRTPDETRLAGGRLAATLGRGAVIALSGELGAGKTCFVQGLADALKVENTVSSPTFTLVNEYAGHIPVHHIDLYRIGGEDEALDMGLDEYMFGEGVAAIEWSERVRSILPAHTIYVSICGGDDKNERIITITQAGEERLEL